MAKKSGKRNSGNFLKLILIILGTIFVLLSASLVILNRFSSSSRAGLTLNSIKPITCDLYGQYLQPDQWLNRCCGSDDAKYSPYKCVVSESASGFIRSKVYYQFNCANNSYQKCSGPCIKGIGYPVCSYPIDGSTISLPTPTLSITPTPTSTPNPTPLPSSGANDRFKKFFSDNGIPMLVDPGKGVIIKKTSQRAGEAISPDLANQLDQLIVTYSGYSSMSDYVFQATGNQYKYIKHYDYGGIKGDNKYLYYYIWCNTSSNNNVCFNPSDSKCNSNCAYGKSVTLSLENDNINYLKWAVMGRIPESVYPLAFSVTHSANLFQLSTMASDNSESAVTKESVLLTSGSRVFLGYDFQGGGRLLIEVYINTLSQVSLRGIFLNGY